MKCDHCQHEVERLRRARDRIRNILLPAWERADLELDRAMRVYRKGRHICAGINEEERT